MHRHVVPQLMHTLYFMILNKKKTVLSAASQFRADTGSVEMREE